MAVCRHIYHQIGFTRCWPAASDCCIVGGVNFQHWICNRNNPSQVGMTMKASLCGMHLSASYFGTTHFPFVIASQPVFLPRPTSKNLYGSLSASFLQAQRDLVPNSSLVSFATQATSSLDLSLNPSPFQSNWHELGSPASSVYIHIPFCRRRCFYCDFPIVAVGERTESKSAHMDAGMLNYVDLVCREIRLSAMANPSSPLKTVFFGGGTPSLLPPPLLLRIIETLRTHFGIESGAEISIEMDPGTFDLQSLRQLMEGGVTRVSMGVQSFQSELLEACGRAHGLREVYEAIDAIHASGLKNWSLDLISSLPNQTLGHWEHTLKEAVMALPAHISVYDLQIEEGTLFNRWYKAGQAPLPSDEKSAEFYKTASAKLRAAGYEHYEISNYAKEGYQCRHNLVYWHNLPYFAVGLGSTSYVGGKRFSRPRKFKGYAEFVEKFEQSGGQIDCLQDSCEERVLDTVMLSLRLAQGLDIRKFESRFGPSVAAVVCKSLLPFAKSGHVVALDISGKPLPVEVLARVGEEKGKEPQFLSDECLVVNTMPSDACVQPGIATEQIDPRMGGVCFAEPAASCTSNQVQVQGLVGEGFESQYEKAETPWSDAGEGLLENQSVRVESTDQVSGTVNNLGTTFLSSDVSMAAFVRLTDPEGFLLSNEVIASIFSALPSGGNYLNCI